jgi:hypothetical protein
MPESMVWCAYLWVPKFFQHDSEAASIRKLRVRLSCSREIGIDLDAIADVGHQQKGRPPMIERQRLGVPFSLSLGLEHGARPSRCAASRSAPFHTLARRLAKKI